MRQKPHECCKYNCWVSNMTVRSNSSLKIIYSAGARMRHLVRRYKQRNGYRYTLEDTDSCDADHMPTGNSASMQSRKVRAQSVRAICEDENSTRGKNKTPLLKTYKIQVNDQHRVRQQQEKKSSLVLKMGGLPVRLSGR